MPANLKNSAVATGLEKVSFHSNPKERQCQRMFKLPYNCTHFTCQQDYAQNPSSWLQLYMNWELPDVRTEFRKGREGSNRGWNGWMALLTQWTWVCASSGRWWRTGKPGVLLSMGLQSQIWLSDWIELKNIGLLKLLYHSTHAFIHFFNNYLLCALYVADTVVTTANKTKSCCGAYTDMKGER